MRTIRETLTRVAAAITVLAIMVLPPLGVIALIGSPFPQWARLRGEVASGSLTNDTTMRVAALIGLALWVWAVVVIAAEQDEILVSIEIRNCERRV